MDRTDRGSPDRSGMPDTCPAPRAGGAQHSCRPSRDGAPNALGTPEFPSIRRAWCLPTPLSHETPRSPRRDILTPVLLKPFESCLYVGAAIAALHGITFDRELCTWLQCSTTPASRVRCPTSTSRSQRRVAREFHRQPPRACRQPRACCKRDRHAPHPALASNPVRGLPPSAGAAVDVFGLRSNQIPDAVRQSVIQEYPRLGFKREFAGLLRAEAKQVPSWPRLVPTRLP